MNQGLANGGEGDVEGGGGRGEARVCVWVGGWRLLGGGGGQGGGR